MEFRVLLIFLLFFDGISLTKDIASRISIPHIFLHENILINWLESDDIRPSFGYFASLAVLAVFENYTRIRIVQLHLITHNGSLGPVLGGVQVSGERT